MSINIFKRSLVPITPKAVNHKDTPRGFGSLSLVVFNTVVIFILSQFIAAFVVMALASVFHGNSASASVLDDSIAAQFFYVLIAESLSVWLVLKLIQRRGLKLLAIGLGRKPTWGDATKAVVGFLVYYALLVVITLVMAWLLPNFNTDQKQYLGFNNINSTGDNILAFVALVILPPLGEETLVRGYLYSGLRSKLKYLPALLVTSLIFGLAHLEIGNGNPLVWGAAIETFVLSIVLVHLREKTGALYAGMLVHLANNLIAFGVHFHG